MPWDGVSSIFVGTKNRWSLRWLGFKEGMINKKLMIMYQIIDTSPMAFFATHIHCVRRRVGVAGP